ncbi:MAG: hypothetical protein K0B08_01675 [Bacteroidales bacterium]|nr:hypothetical protein [Bacteroidales bacterium]
MPIAVIENSSYDEVETALATINLSVDDLQIKSENDLIGIFNDLRSHLPYSLITSYTYDPFIGITSVTKSNGITVFYEYDDFGRLQTIFDNSKYILNRYMYNYGKINTN